jgi:hypothetical protein
MGLADRENVLVLRMTTGRRSGIPDPADLPVGFQRSRLKLNIFVQVGQGNFHGD